MKTAIVFYSFSGNTRAVCGFLRETIVASGGSVETVELRLRHEERSFVGQGAAARARLTPSLVDTGFDPLRYDSFVFASPVWAFTFTPALRSFLADVPSLGGKPCGCVLTCGAQITSGNALMEFSRIVGEKGGRVSFSTYVSGSRKADRGYLMKRFSGLVSALTPV